jgi:hypothetical protein
MPYFSTTTPGYAAPLLGKEGNRFEYTLIKPAERLAYRLNH